MKLNYALSSLIIGASAIILQPLSTLALSSTEVAKIAEEITVLIDSRKSGSGVIINKRGNTYTILTAAHVIRPNLKHEIVTPNGQRYSLDNSKVKTLPGVDLAIVKFSSSKNYKTAKIGNSDTSNRGTVSYLGGFPRRTATVNRSIFYFAEGKVVANSQQPLNDGYGLIYTNNTTNGMSGGPVLNEKGELVGIHGRGDMRYDEQTDTLAKSDFNLGIPINTFVRFSKKVEMNIGVSVPRRVKIGSKAEDLFVKATNRYEKKDYQGAIANYTKAIALNPWYAEAFFGRGNSYYHLEDFKAAIADYSQALKVNPKYADGPYSNRGAANYALKNFQAALADYNQALEISPNDPLIYNNRGNIHSDLKDFKAALNDYNNAIKINPNYAVAYNNRGTVYFDLKEFTAAIADFNQAIKINPDYADVYQNRGLVHLQLKNFRAAFTDFNQVIKINPKYPNAYNYRGLVRTALRDFQGANIDFKEAIKINPNDFNSYFGLGLVRHKFAQRSNTRSSSGMHVDLISYRKAIAQYQQALTKNPSFFPAIANIGLIKYEQGDLEGAIKQWQTALSIERHPETMIALAVALYTKRQKEGAIAIAQNAFDKDEKFANLKHLQENLWGPLLIADTKKFFALPEIQKFLSQNVQK